MRCIALYIARALKVCRQWHGWVEGCMVFCMDSRRPKNADRHDDGGRFAAISKEQYDRLLAAYRELPGNASAASRRAEVTRKTATRAWRTGWPSRKWPPIRTVLEEEQRLARAARFEAVTLAAANGVPEHEIETSVAKLSGQGAREGNSQLQAAPTDARRRPGIAAELDRLKAQQDAIEARTQEAQLVKMSRGNTIALMASTSHLLKSAIQRASDLDQELRTGKATLTPQQVTRFVTGCAYLAKSAAEAGKLTMEMERLLLGAPTEIIGIRADRLSLDDASAIVGMAARALARVKEQDVVAECVVVEGHDLPPKVPAPGAVPTGPTCQEDLADPEEDDSYSMLPPPGVQVH